MKLQKAITLRKKKKKCSQIFIKILKEKLVPESLF